MQIVKTETDRNINIEIKVESWKKGVKVVVERKAALEFGINTKMEDILRFEDDTKKIKNAIKKAYKNGDYIDMSLCVANYRTDHFADGSFDNKQLSFDYWKFSGYQDNEDGLYLTPDTRYTSEDHDIWLDYKESIFKSLTF